MACSHSKTESTWIIDEDYETGETTGRWEYEEVSAYVDIDLHRFKCSICNEVRYYSHAAQQYYEKGVKSPVEGLEN